jgi:DNA-directed RNA polymerase subunit K/omega
MDDDKYADDDEYIPSDDDNVDDDNDDVIKTMNKKSKVIPTNINDDDEDADDLEDDDDEDVEDLDDLDDDDEEDPDEENIGNTNNVMNNTNIPHFDEIEDDDDDDDEEDNNYLQKFDENVKQNIIAEFHPELKAYNYDEVDVLTRVVRDENGIIIDPLHKTLPFITRYEKARILGERAKQINAGAKPMVEIEPNVIDGYLIAMKEFESKAIPFIIQRPLPNGGVEMWKFADLEILA